MKEIAGKLALLGFSLLFVLVVAEIAIRIVVGPPPSGVHIHQLLCEYDPVLGWSKIPNASERYITEEYDITETINSKGLRGPEYSYDKEEGTFRVLAVGDSFTEGYTVEFQELFSEVLGRRLSEARPERQFEVINGGTGGYSTDQELVFYRSEGRKYQPDLVVLMFVDNDVWYNAQPEYPRAPKPLLELRDEGLVVVNQPVPEPPSPAPAPGEDQPESLAQRAKSAVSESSALYRLVRQRIKDNYTLHTAAIRLGLAEAPDDDGGPIAVPDPWTVFEKDASPAVERAWDMTEHILLALREEASAEDTQVLVAKIPSSFALREDQWNATVRKYGVEREDWSPSLVTERVADICRRGGIPYLDLTPDFRDAIEAGRAPLFFPIDGHWTPEGHRLAGESLADYVIRDLL